MLLEQCRHAIMVSPLSALDALASKMWAAYNAEVLSTPEIVELHDLVISRRKCDLPTKPPRSMAPRMFVGARPRSSESMERRRRWAASGWLPPAIAARFTLAEQAVLAVVAHRVAQHGQCMMPAEKIAAIAGVGLSTARNAIRQAKALGFLSVTVRPSRPFRNLPNVIRLASEEWGAWVARRLSSPVKTLIPTKEHIYINRTEPPKAKALTSKPPQEAVGRPLEGIPLKRW